MESYGVWPRFPKSVLSSSFKEKVKFTLNSLNMFLKDRSQQKQVYTCNTTK